MASDVFEPRQAHALFLLIFNFLERFAVQKKKIHPWKRFANGSARTRDFNKKISASAQFIIQISITPIWEIMKLMMIVIMWEA